MFKHNIKILFKASNHQPQSGTTLVETVISVALIGIIAIALAMGLITASNVLLHTDARETAKNIAETQLEYIKGNIQECPFNASATTYLTSFDAVLRPSAPVIPNGYTVLPNEVELISGRNDIQQITITITGAGINYTLKGYKTKW